MIVKKRMQPCRLASARRWALVLAWTLTLAPVGLAQSDANPDRAEPVLADAELEVVSVNWGEELLEGGVTMIALGALSVAMLAFAVERLVVLRTRRFIPAGLTKRVKPLFAARDFEGIRTICDQHPSTLSRVIQYMANHHQAPPELVAQTAGDLGAREIVDQEQKTVPFAVIAALAPLLGLLGTMIGMIEAFKLVEVFGDEGGASMLAGSISKALITTAVGLILAIPAITLYHYFKHRLHVITQSLERETEDLYSAWFVTAAPGSIPARGNASGSPTASVTGSTTSAIAPGAAPKPKAEAIPKPAGRL